MQDRQDIALGRIAHFILDLHDISDRFMLKNTSIVRYKDKNMKLKVIIHEAEEGGYWAEVPAISGCATQGETIEELMNNLSEAIEGCLSIDVQFPKTSDGARIVEIAI